MNFPTIPGLSEAQDRWDNMLPPEDPHPKCACGHKLSDHFLIVDDEKEDCLWDDACSKCGNNCLYFQLAFDRRDSMDGFDRFRDRVHDRDTEVGQ